MQPRAHPALLAGMLIVSSLAVSAQAAGLPQDANGIKLGDARVHPFVEADSHYVVNPGRRPSNSPNDVVVVGRTGADIDLPSDSLDLTFRGDLEYQRYLGLQDPSTKGLSTFAGQLGLDMNLNKQGAVGIRVHESFVRGADPANETLHTRLLHVSNDLGVGLDIRPGGGALIFSPEYRLFIDHYDRAIGVPQAELLDNMRHMPQLRVSWKFLPKTALFLEAQGIITRFYSSSQNVGTNILLAQLGAAGSITQRVAFLLKAGYGNTFLPSSDNFESFVGQIELDYLTSATTRFRIGVLRTVSPTSLFKYYDMIRGYVGIDQSLGGKLNLGGKLAYNYLDFGDPVVSDSTARTDGDLTAELEASWQLTEWLVISAVDRLDWRITNYDTPAGTSAAYVFNDLFLRVGARY